MKWSLLQNFSGVSPCRFSQVQHYECQSGRSQILPEVPLMVTPSTSTPPPLTPKEKDQSLY